MAYNVVGLVGTNGSITEYGSTAGGGGSSSAADVSYDNTTSGIDAENVQDAIDLKANGAGLTFSVDSSGILNITY